MNVNFFRMACAAALAALPVLAQTPDKQQDKFFFERHTAVAGSPADVISFIGAPMHLEGATVKGAPYSAEAVSETVQVLANGNRIVRKNTSQIFRDSDGRTRREETMSGVGPWASSGGAKQFVSIGDPTTNSYYHLDPDTKTARKIGFRVQPDLKGAGPEKGVQVMMRSGAVAGAAAHTMEYRAVLDSQNAKNEDLGQKMMEGVMARGTRSTVTIPAGAIGNEQPIETVTERWYSDELKTVVLTKTNDPRFGDTTYRLSNIRRADPPAYLFQVPADYKVEDMPAPGPNMIHFEKK